MRFGRHSMADDRYRQEHPQRSYPEDHSSQAPRHYPSPLDEPRAPSDPSRPGMAASVTLPSIHESRPGGYGAPPPAGRNYGHDPHYGSPNAINGYPPPPAGGQQVPQPYLPPMQQQTAYPHAEHRGPYYDDRRGPPPEVAYQDPYYYHRAGPPGVPPPNGYPRPHPGQYAEYGQPAGMQQQMAQAAPRQRTSIACRYCRKRKIRCSGYQSAPGGKCQNCARMNQECIFQPVSSSASTAFVPVSALSGPVPPGTQLFGAYGQPLAPNSVPGSHQYHAGGGPPPPASGNYYPAMQSPTESYSSYGDPRGEEQATGRRRRRTPEEHEDGYRLPPPRSNMPDDDPRRRSPAEGSSTGSPGGVGHAPYQGTTSRHSPHDPNLTQPPTSGSHAPQTAEGRSPQLAGQNGSSGASTPSQAQRSAPGATSSVMSVSSLVGKTDIDQGMINRLNRPRDAKGSPPTVPRPETPR